MRIPKLAPKPNYIPRHAAPLRPEDYYRVDDPRYIYDLDKPNTPPTAPLGIKESAGLLVPKEVKERLKESPLHKAVGKLALQALGVAQAAALRAREAIAPKERRAQRPLAQQVAARPNWAEADGQGHRVEGKELYEETPLREPIPGHTSIDDVDAVLYMLEGSPTQEMPVVKTKAVPHSDDPHVLEHV